MSTPVHRIDRQLAVKPATETDPEQAPKRRRARARRGRNEGGVYQRADGRWEGSKSLGFDSNGRRIRIRVYGETKTEALEKLGKASGTANAIAQPGSLTVAQFIDQWLDASKQAGRRPTTIAAYRSVIATHVLPRIGGVQLRNVARANIVALQTTLDREEISLRMRQAVHTALRVAFVYAKENHFVSANPLDGMKRPGGAKQARVGSEMEAWTENEVRSFLAACKGHRLEALFVVALGTGLRRGELCALTRRDVDLKKGTIAVRRTLSEVAGKFSLQVPKTDRSHRLVTLPAHALQSLRAHIDRLPVDQDLIFADENGNYLRRSNLDRRVFHPLVKEAGVHPISIHGLRHTHATLLLASGLNVKVISERLGHTSIAFTLSTYAHAIPSMQADAASRFDSVFAPETSRASRKKDGRKKKRAAK